MGNTVFRFLHKLLKKRTGVFVFLNLITQNPYTDLKRSWRSLLKKVRIEDFTFHDFGCIFTTEFLRKYHKILAHKYVRRYKSIQISM